ncbi:MAG: restriction endonuclease subunit M [Bacteroidales bacterium]
MITKEYITELKQSGNGDIASLVNAPRDVGSIMDKGWILRNDVIWDQKKGTQSSKDMIHTRCTFRRD